MRLGYLLRTADRPVCIDREALKPVERLQVLLRKWEGSLNRGLLVPVGEKRGRFCVTSDDLKLLREKTREPRIPVPDPFA